MVAARRRSVAAAPSRLASAFRPGEEHATVPTERWRPSPGRSPGELAGPLLPFSAAGPPLPIVVARKAKARSGQARCSAARRHHDRPRLGCDGPAGAGARTQRLSAAPSSLGEISSRSGPPLSEGQPTGGPCLRRAARVERPEAIGSLRLRCHYHHGPNPAAALAAGGARLSRRSEPTVRAGDHVQVQLAKRRLPERSSAPASGQDQQERWLRSQGGRCGHLPLEEPPHDPLNRLFRVELSQVHLTVVPADTPEGSRSQHASQWDAASPLPLYVLQQSSEIVKVWSHAESLTSVNIKKAVASMLQYQLTPEDKYQVDVSGRCSVSFKTERNIITKHKSSCTHPDKTQFINPNPIQSPTVLTESTSLYELLPDMTAPKNVRISERTQMYVNILKEASILVKAEHTYKLESTSPSGQTFTAATEAGSHPRS
ncbi:hypothetical protein MTO96_016030 [Rhipicephalus appendiculatus]